MKIKDILISFIEEINELEAKIKQGENARNIIDELQLSCTKLRDENYGLQSDLNRRTEQIKEQEKIITISGREIQSLKEKNTKLYNELIQLKANQADAFRQSRE